jgi:hypothetical protein
MTSDDKEKGQTIRKTETSPSSPTVNHQDVKSPVADVDFRAMSDQERIKHLRKLLVEQDARIAKLETTVEHLVGAVTGVRVDEKA